MQWLRDFAGALSAPVTEFLRGRAERQRIREQARGDVARTEAATVQQSAEAAAVVTQTQTEAEKEWDLVAAHATERSWKDELWTVVAVIPIVLCFIPGMAGFVASGFAALDGAPGWFQLLVGASVSFSFGIRHIVHVMQSRWGARGR